MNQLEHFQISHVYIILTYKHIIYYILIKHYVDINIIIGDFNEQSSIVTLLYITIHPHIISKYKYNNLIGISTMYLFKSVVNLF